MNDDAVIRSMLDTSDEELLADAGQDRMRGRCWAIKLIVIGIGGLVLPCFGLQSEVLKSFGWAMPIAAVVIATSG